MVQVALSTTWTSIGGWRLDVGGGLAWFEGSESNRRTQASLGLSRRLHGGWNLATSLRTFHYRRDLTGGYFDPDFYGIAEIVGSWRWEPSRLSFLLEAAPGVWQVTGVEDPTGALRASARVAYRWRPGRELSLSAGISTAGLQSFSTGSSDYDYTAIVAGASWVF